MPKGGKAVKGSKKSAEDEEFSTVSKPIAKKPAAKKPEKKREAEEKVESEEEVLEFGLASPAPNANGKAKAAKPAPKKRKVQSIEASEIPAGTVTLPGNSSAGDELLAEALDEAAEDEE